MPGELTHQGLLVRVSDGSTELREFPGSEVLGPVDFGWHMQQEGDYFCIGSGVLSGSIIPGSDRLFVTGRSPVWGGFYVSALGGGALVWDGIGIHSLGIQGRAPEPSVLILQGRSDRYPVVRIVPVDLETIWGAAEGPGGFYALQQHVFENLWDGAGTPRVLAVGPAAGTTRIGAIGSSRTSRGKITAVDCWAGRGGSRSKLLQGHNLCAVVYGGDYEDEDLSDRAEADGYFKKRFSKKMLLEDLEATTKYRYDPHWKSGGTFGVNYAKLSDWMLSFNYRSTGWSKDDRVALWERLVRDHYLEQFNRETIEQEQFAHCGEPCPAVCKKLNREYKKDYEPYQTMGPLTGIFDQRAAERVNHRADALGFDAIQIGGQLAWVMECLQDGILDAGDLGLADDVPDRPVFDPRGFDPVSDSDINARLALALLDKCAEPGHLLAGGMRAAAHRLGPAAQDRAVYLANGEAGWMVPNQYWVPGMFAPMAVMGKYYVHYGHDFHAPRELGRRCAERMIAEVTTDNAGMCRFHRGWSEELWPDIVQGHFGIEIDYPAHHARLARAIHEQGAPVFWESRRIGEMLHGYLRRVREAGPGDRELEAWFARFETGRETAARAYWEELRAGVAERMGELPGMTLDLIFWFVVFAFAIIGFFSGFWRQLMRLGALVGAYLLAGILGKPLGPWLSGSLGIPALLGRILGTGLLFILLYAVFSTVGYTLLRRRERRRHNEGLPGGKAVWERLAGAGLGGAKVFLVLYLVLCVVVMMEGPLAGRAGGRLELFRDSGMAGLARNHNVITGLHIPVVGDAAALGKIATDPDFHERAMRDPEVRRLISHPKIKALLDDPVLIKAARSRDIAAILANPRLNEALEDPGVQKLAADVDLGSI